MGKSIKMDGVGFDTDFIQSFESEKSFVDWFISSPHLAHFDEKTRVKKAKATYKLWGKPKRSVETMTEREG